MKRFISASLQVLFSFAINFGIFLYFYKILAFPFLHEAQRMENAPIIFSYVLLAFFVSSIISAAMAIYISNKRA